MTINNIIQTLRYIDIDGETTQYILEQIGMDEQMAIQLATKYPKVVQEHLNELETNKYEDTADKLLGISDDWGYSDIKEHLKWLINNPNEIADGYDKSVFKTSNIDAIMNEVRIRL